MTDLHVHDVGSGLPVVAIHGLGLDHHLMTGLLEPICASRPGLRRIYLDLPGCGRSRMGETTTTQQVVDRVQKTVLELLPEGPMLLVGESYGGYVARELTARLRHRVQGLALICPIGLPVRSERTLPEHVILREEAGLAEALAELAPEAGEAYRSVTVSQTAETLARFRAEVEPGTAAADWPALDRMQAEGYALPEPPERGTPIDIPTLIVTGRQDSVVGYADQWALLAHYPRATYAVLDEAGHNAHFERADLTNALINDWLDRLH